MTDQANIALNEPPDTWWQRLYDFFPGLALAALIAMASQFIADNSQVPAMLMALVIGLMLNFLSQVPRCKPGIAYGAKPVLRIGVALLGARISFEMVTGLGLPTVLLIAGAVFATIGFGLVTARLAGFQYRFGFLSAGAVAICGASAAIAIAAVLPRDERSEDRLVFTIVGVTVLSTVAMIAYPPVTHFFGLSEYVAGVFLGATIHDVAQVVGAGFSISNEAGETATLVKLLRVSMLAPIVIGAALIIRFVSAAREQGRETSSARPPLMPGFVMVFVLLAAINSFFAVPPILTQIAATLSGWLLLLAIAAVGLKTRLGDVVKVGKSAVAFLIAQTLFIAIFFGLGLHALGVIALW
jgi:uncharacterized integral membrane protein (TIGR00698 family)